MKIYSMTEPEHPVIIIPPAHVCLLGTTGRCPCGLYQDPKRGGVRVETLATAREQLAFQL